MVKIDISMRTKKMFIQPSLEIVMVNAADVIATSDPQSISISFSEIPEEEGYAD